MGIYLITNPHSNCTDMSHKRRKPDLEEDEEGFYMENTDRECAQGVLEALEIFHAGRKLMGA